MDAAIGMYKEAAQGTQGWEEEGVCVNLLPLLTYTKHTLLPPCPYIQTKENGIEQGIALSVHCSHA